MEGPRCAEGRPRPATYRVATRQLCASLVRRLTELSAAATSMACGDDTGQAVVNAVAAGQYGGAADRAYKRLHTETLARTEGFRRRLGVWIVG